VVKLASAAAELAGTEKVEFAAVKILASVVLASFLAAVLHTQRQTYADFYRQQTSVATAGECRSLDMFEYVTISVKKRLNPLVVDTSIELLQLLLKRRPIQDPFSLISTEGGKKFAGGRLEGRPVYGGAVILGRRQGHWCTIFCTHFRYVSSSATALERCSGTSCRPTRKITANYRLEANSFVLFVLPSL
jgi:hypothetical protein